MNLTPTTKGLIHCWNAALVAYCGSPCAKPTTSLNSAE